MWTTIFILPAWLGFLRPFSFRILFYLQGCQQTRSHHSALQSNTTLMIKTKSALSLTFVRIILFFLSESPTMHSFCPRNLHLLSFSNAPGTAGYSQQYLRTKSSANLGVKSVLWSIRTDSQQGGTKTGNGRMKNGNKTSLEPSPYQ